MSERSSNCPDCKGAMQPIKLIDATRHVLGQGMTHVELEYAAADAAPSFVSGTIKSQGIVTGLICSECGRIVFYGQPV